MTGRGIRRPSHATIVAYLALFIALATGVSWAATKITSSKQIAKNVVTGKHVKNGTLKGKDIKDGKLTGVDVKDGSLAGADITDNSLAGADLKDGSVAAADLGPNSVAAAKIADGSVTGADVTNKSLTGADINIGSLGFGKGYTAEASGGVNVYNGNGTGFPIIPQGDLQTLDLAPGRYFVMASVRLSSVDGSSSGVLCQLQAGGENAVTGADTDSDDFVPANNAFLYTPGAVSVGLIATLPVATTVHFSCSDDQTGATASDRRIDAVSLVP